MANRCISNAILIEATQRLAAYYGKFARTQSESGLSGYTQLDAERPQIMQVIGTCHEREKWQAVSELVWAVDGYLDIQGYWTERRTALEIGIVAAQQQENRSNEGAFLGNLGVVYHTLGQVDKAIEYEEQALTIARELGDRQGERVDLGNLGAAYHTLGQMDKAIASYEQALTIARELGDRQGGRRG